MDYVVQSFDKNAKFAAANWQFFAIQFPEKAAAFVVEWPNPLPKFPMAKFFRSTTSRMPNGALLAEKEWTMDEISVTPDPQSLWTSSTRSGLKYFMKYTLSLESADFPINLTLTSKRDNQEAYIYIPGIMKKRIAKYEGVFEVSGTVNNETYSGYAWGEVDADNLHHVNTDGCCCPCCALM